MSGMIRGYSSIYHNDISRLSHQILKFGACLGTSDAESSPPLFGPGLVSWGELKLSSSMPHPGQPTPQ